MSTLLSDAQAKAAILEIGRRMDRRGMVAANDGNISIRVKDGFWCTPTGVAKGYMTEDMLCKIDHDRRVLEGHLQPSSEIKMHLRVFDENPDLTAVVHAHPVASTSFAAAGLPLDDALLTEAVVSIGVVPLSPFALPGSDALPDAIAPYVKGYSAVLLANHGVLTWGRDAFEAYYRMETVEHYAQILLNVRYGMRSDSALSGAQVSALLEIRKALGITTGGTPRTF